jgi:hypothetical protein
VLGITTFLLHLGAIIMGLSSDVPDNFLVGLRAINNRLAPENPKFAEWALTMMQSESGIRPDVKNHAGQPFYGLIQLGAPSFAPLTPEQFLKLTHAQQLPYIEKFYKAARIDRFRSPGNLYQFNFVPASLSRGLGPDTIIAAKGGKGYNGNEDMFYNANPRLDRDGDGAITVKDLDARMEAIAADPRVQEVISRLPPADTQLVGLFNQPTDTVAETQSMASTGAVLLIAAGVGLAIHEWTKKS